MRPEQVTMFGLLDGYETPQLAVKYRNQGVKAWVIEAAAWKESLKPDAPILYWGVRARRVEFQENAKPDKESASGWWYGKTSFRHIPEQHRPPPRFQDAFRQGEVPRTPDR